MIFLAHGFTFRARRIRDMWQNKRLVVVLPTYNEHLSIASCIARFEGLGIVDEVLVVNNNAHPATSPEVATTGAREVFESIQGYGAAIRRGLAETRDADLVCVCEPDGTFDPEDLLKLLPYTGDVDIVFGSRTVQEFILSGANMGTFLKWGNWAVAKLTEVLFNTVYLSDVGCTFRVLSRDAANRLEPLLTTNASALGYEMMLGAVSQRMPIVQIPVNYRERVGESSVTGSRWKAFVLGMEMIRMCVALRLRTKPSRRPESASERD
jgi:glycosyltransferase involved in cell wall biosynthesis